MAPAYRGCTSHCTTLSHGRENLPHDPYKGNVGSRTPRPGISVLSDATVMARITVRTSTTMSASPSRENSSMHSSILSRFFSEQESRMSMPDESLQEFIGRLSETQRMRAELRDDSHMDSTNTITSKAKNPTEDIQPSARRVQDGTQSGGRDIPRAAEPERVMRNINVIEAPPTRKLTSTKRKSPDHDSGLGSGRHEKKKIKNGQREEPKQMASSAHEQNGRLGTPQRLAGGKDAPELPGSSDLRSPLDPRSSQKPYVGTTDSRTKGIRLPVSKPDHTITVVSAPNKRSAGIRDQPPKTADRQESRSAVVVASSSSGEHAREGSASSSRLVPDLKAVVANPSSDARAKRPSQAESKKNAPPLVPRGRQPKPRLKIPRYSEIKRTYKDGRPRAPVDIDLARQRVYAQRQKIEDKLLCDTGGEIDVAEFLERLYEFYDDDEMRRRSKQTKLFAGTVVFLCPARDSDTIGIAVRRKLQFLVAHGATVLATFESRRVTHVVTCEGVKEEQLFRRTGVNALDDIPEHIPILRWSWVDESWKKRVLEPTNKYPAFKDRVTYAADDIPSPAKEQTLKVTSSSPKTNATLLAKRHRQSDTEDSNDSGDEKISDWRKLLEAQTVSRPRNGRAVDPLAEFYDQARDDIDMEYLSGRRGEEADDPGEGGSEPRAGGEVAQKGVFQCDKKPEGPGGRPGSCLNQDVIDTLAELKALHEVKGTPEDKWRVFAYQKMLGPIRLHKKRIESEAEARTISGVGEKTAKKIMEIIRTGSLRRISYERTQDVYIVMAFQGIYGVGQKTAYKWYASGCRSLDDVRLGKYGVKLSSCQEIGLKYYDDINSRIPRDEAKEIFEMIKSRALQMDPHLFIEIMGSYRRGKETCGDIDVLITRPTSDGKTHVGILRRLIEDLHVRGVITEHLSLPDDWDDLELSYRGLCRRNDASKRRRIDFLTVPYKSRGAALLYYTGDDIFNRSMRLKANKMGYSLNQRGLYKDVIRDPADRRKKLHGGTILASETEREIFDILGVPWQEPHERIRS